MKEKLYFILDNGLKPFLVIIRNKDVYIYKQNDKWKDFDKYNANLIKTPYDKENFNILVKHYKNVNEILIGNSPTIPMTEYSGAYGRQWYGNSILLNIKGKIYVYIGEDIFSFTAFDDIKKFVSPVGNNGVPYPYAIDIDDRYYIFTPAWFNRENETIHFIGYLNIIVSQIKN